MGLRNSRTDPESAESVCGEPIYYDSDKSLEQLDEVLTKGER